ncbi:hypothetical protein HMPREF1584_00921 [Gardnerella vaginalis JCP8481A]|nr:hypothetical protein HMPREF1585_01120 [Gardnerella vaginalis JCP8481B]EPI42554.1 hypothetical protein HMPREF1584_00921 [Gardnerella vaginalis JCP8481A]
MQKMTTFDIAHSCSRMEILVRDSDVYEGIVLKEEKVTSHD